MQKTDRCIVRNEAYQKKSISIRERHNERKNQGYSNPDIVKDRSHLNVYFKRCEGSYAEAFDKMPEAGIISTRGIQPDAKVIDEFIFDFLLPYFADRRRNRKQTTRQRGKTKMWSVKHFGTRSIVKIFDYIGISYSMRILRLAPWNWYHVGNTQNPHNLYNLWKYELNIKPLT